MFERVKSVWNTIRQNPYTGERGIKRFLVLVCLSIISSCYLIFLSVINFIRGNDNLGVIILVCFLINIPVLIHTIRAKNIKIATIIYSGCFMMLYTYAIMTGPNDGGGNLWLFSLPLMNMFCFGIIPGLVINGWLLSFILLNVLCPPLRSILISYPYPEGNLLRLFITYFADFLLSFVIAYEYHSTLLDQLDYASRLKSAVREERDKVRDISMQTIFSINKAVEAKDLYTGEHSRRVADMSRLIAAGMGWNETEQRRIHDIALLHDIGKIGVSWDILNKQGQLTDDEYDSVKMHSVTGGDILAQLDFIRNISAAVRHHHENWDGSGYPDGLAGQAIPVESRIIAVADAFDAMRYDRSFRSAHDRDFIIHELKAGSGSLYDPEITALFLEICQREHLFERKDGEE